MATDPIAQEVLGYGGPPNNGPLFFPFAPNWRSPFDETLTFFSWAMTAEDGSEQTGSINGDMPRREFEYTVTLNHRHTQMLENMLFAYQSRAWFFAHWGEGSKLTSAIAQGAESIPFDTTMRSFTTTGLAVIYRDPDHWEIVTATTKSDTGITISNGGTQFAWPAGARVYPLFEGYINASLSGRRKTDSLVEMPISFTCEPSKTETNTPQGSPVATYRGVELYRGRLNWASDVESSFNSDVRVLDYKAGQLKVHSASRWTPNVRKHQVLLKDMLSIFSFRQWLARREGMARPCWMESGMTDFTPAEPLAAGAQAIRVQKNRYGQLAAAHPARRDIIILMRDGTYLVRRITAVAQYSADADNLLIDAPLPAGFSMANFKRISYLNRYRLASQEVTLRWVTDSVVTCDVNLRPQRTALDMASTSPPMPAGKQGSTFSYLYSATGGVRPYTWALQSGTLPPGLTLTSTGVLTGIPMDAGAWAFTVAGTDVEGNVVTVTRTLTVQATAEIEIIPATWSMSSSWPGIALPPSSDRMRDANVAGGFGSSTGARTSEFKNNAVEFIRADLGASHVVRRVTLGGGSLPAYGAYVADNLNGRLLQCSDNNIDWTTILIVSGITDTGQLDKDFSFPDTLARYWRVASANPYDPVGAATFRFFGFPVG